MMRFGGGRARVRIKNAMSPWPSVHVLKAGSHARKAFKAHVFDAGTAPGLVAAARDLHKRAMQDIRRIARDGNMRPNGPCGSAVRMANLMVTSMQEAIEQHAAKAQAGDSGEAYSLYQCAVDLFSESQNLRRCAPLTPEFGWDRRKHGRARYLVCPVAGRVAVTFAQAPDFHIERLCRGRKSEVIVARTKQEAVREAALRFRVAPRAASAVAVRKATHRH